MVSVCLASDAFLQHLPSYLGFSYLGHGVSLHSCSRKAQPLLLTLDKGYLLTTTLPDLQRGMAPLGLPAPAQPPLLGRAVAPPSRSLWPRAPPLASDAGWLVSAFALDLGRRVAPPGRCPWPRTWGSSSWPFLRRRSPAL